MRLLMSGYVRVEYVQFEATSRIGQPAGGLSVCLARFATANGESIRANKYRPKACLPPIEQNLCASVLFGTEVAYRVSNIVAYIITSLPGIAQLSPSDQPAPLLCGAFFFDSD
ncbi:hypothetical protein [Agrobacterium genomosp. 13]|uniref:Uncharacterized protein n=1 Tax=Agrobacterium genomosp. 13 str. CFBP 6927 TaxID=1183428 RepID=A0ABP2BFT9_9HYPH|nr:hypothetical protein [Agrobacterium genomosp. 13]CUX14274.1 hypothetical protein AGR13a_Cc170310 [Agrobacterium genomosp. 13 str. CFBP 6927]